jgi:formylglycine-generating enzyme required for sulfatase activity
LKYESIEIKPTSIHNERHRKRPAFLTLLKWLGWTAGAVVVVVLALSIFFVFSAKQVALKIEPEPDSIAVQGGLAAPRLGDYFLLRPGKYTLRAQKACYESLDHSFQVGAEKSQRINLKMQKQPGRLSIQTHQQDNPDGVVDRARVFIDAIEVGTTPLSEIKVSAGRHRVQIQSTRYQAFDTEITVNGCDDLQTFRFALIPGWSDIKIGSIPEGAEVRIDDTLKGKTPLQIELPAGTYRLELIANRFKSWKTQLVVEPNKPQQIENVRLEPADGILAVRTNPAGANVMVGKRFVGRTPLKTNITPDKVHVIQVSKPGYEKVSRKMKVSAAGSKTLELNLKAQKGTIRITIEPADAQLLVNGKLQGTVPQKIQLVAVEHQLEFRKKGYQSQRVKITPRPGFPQKLQIALKKQYTEPAGPQSLIKAKNGYALKLIKPETFALGSSRREQGRRSNETLRKIKLLRPFYMGVHEVTNKMFETFLADHNSGSFKGKSLNRDDQPVVQVTWQQAAMFCNWLSVKDSLPPAYEKKGSKMVLIKPPTIGYRLPTEAEWEYCARRSTQKDWLKYPWGNAFPPPAQSGNFADASAKGLLNSYLANYNDGYAVTAPPAKFKANSLGLHDFGGNVAEWTHDFYTIYSYDAKKVYIDPTGPDTGKHHVVKGSSWKDAGISALRLAHRDYNNSKRDDLGFRMCRYAE